MLSVLSAAQAQNTCGNGYLYQGLCYSQCPVSSSAPTTAYTTAVVGGFNLNTCVENTTFLSAPNGCSIPGYLKLENRCVEFCPVTTFRRFNYCIPRPISSTLQNECHENAPHRLGTDCVIQSTCNLTYYSITFQQNCIAKPVLTSSNNWCPTDRPFLNIFNTTPVFNDNTNCHHACREDMIYDEFSRCNQVSSSSCTGTNQINKYYYGDSLNCKDACPVTHPYNPDPSQKSRDCSRRCPLQFSPNFTWRVVDFDCQGSCPNGTFLSLIWTETTPGAGDWTSTPELVDSDYS